MRALRAVRLASISKPVAVFVSPFLLFIIKVEAGQPQSHGNEYGHPYDFSA
jgi:hypothetical protein